VLDGEGAMAEVTTQAYTTLVCMACQEARPWTLSCIHTFTGLYATNLSYTAPCEHPDNARLNERRKREHAELGQARPRQSRPSLLCPAKDCGAPCAAYATGSYFDSAGKRDFLFYDVTCVNGHSTFAHRLAPEDVAPEPVAAKAALVATTTRTLFEAVVNKRYRELHKIARKALDGGKISGAEDCVQEAIAALLLDGSYASCADEGEIFGQLAVTVRNRARATIKCWAKDRKRHRSLTIEHVRPNRWSDGNDEIVGKVAEREVSADGDGVDRAIDSELLPPRVERTRDLRLDAARALCEEPAVPLNVQLVLVHEISRVELLQDVGPGNLHMRRTILNNSITHSYERLGKRLQDYRPALAQERQWRGGLLVPDSANEQRYTQRWLDGLSAAFRRALRRRRDTSLFQRLTAN
jgi:hypothetical protein